MRLLLLILTLSILSCGQSDTKQKELELKERELALKEKELELKERNSTQDSSVKLTPPKTTIETSSNVSPTEQIGNKNPVPDGTYKYEIWDYEYSQPMHFGKTCTVIIKGKTIKVVGTNVRDEEFTERGLLLKHQKTGKWFIGQTESEQYLEEIPYDYAWIDFKLKRYCHY